MVVYSAGMPPEARKPLMLKESGQWEIAYRKTRRDLTTRRRRICLFQLDHGQSILDLGCGDGLDLRIFRELGYMRAYGLDRSFGLLAHARSLPVIQGDIYAMPVASCSFDAVFANGVLHHLGQVEKAVSEIKRVLVQGGVLCLIEPTSSPLRRLANAITLSRLARFSEFLTLRKQMLTEELPCHERWLAMEKGFPSLLEGLGLQIVFRKRTAFSVFIKARANQG